MPRDNSRETLSPGNPISLNLIFIDKFSQKQIPKSWWQTDMQSYLYLLYPNLHRRYTGHCIGTGNTAVYRQI